MRRTLVLLFLLIPSMVASAGELSYIFHRGDSTITAATDMPIESVVALTKRWSGDYIWVRLDGREYLIRDSATLGEARKAFAEVDAFHAVHEAAMERLRPVERRHDALEERVDEIGDRLSDDARHLTEREIESLEAQLRKLEKELEPLERELQKLEREEERLDQKMEQLEKVAERKLGEIIRRAIRTGAARTL